MDSKEVWGFEFSDVWSENAARFKRFMKIHSNPWILYYGSKPSSNAAVDIYIFVLKCKWIID